MQFRASFSYFVVFMLDQWLSINDLVDKNQTLVYLTSFYANNPSDLDNYGGYFPKSITKYCQLSSTYYCVKAISILDEDLLNKAVTLKWVLSRQNFQDGGFSDLTDGYEQLFSSNIASYYAFKTLATFDSGLSKLSANIWMVEFNYVILS